MKSEETNDTIYLALSLVSVSTLFAAAVWADFIHFYFDIDWPQQTLLAFSASIAALIALVSKRPIQGAAFVAIIISAFLGLVLISLARGVPLASCSLAYAPIVGLLFAFVDLRAIRIVVIFTLIVCAFVALYEVATQRFVFYYVIDGVVLDEKHFLGASDAFRAKGLFAGPTAASAFAIVAIMLSGRSVVVPVVAIALCALTSSRSTILFGAVFLVCALLTGNKAERRAASLGFFLVAVLAIAAVQIGILGSNTVLRILNIFSSQDSGNVSRFYYWALSVDLYFFKYTTIEQLFGDPRATYRIFQSSAENEYLQLFLDTGLVGFLMYAFAFARAGWFARVDRMEFGKLVGLIVVIFAVAMISQAGNCILIWVFIWQHFMGLANPDAGRGTARPAGWSI